MRMKIPEGFVVSNDAQDAKETAIREIKGKVSNQTRLKLEKNIESTLVFGSRNPLMYFMHHIDGC